MASIGSKAATRVSWYAGSKIVAIGRNFAKHALEMGHDGAKPAAPFYFFKPNSSVTYPPGPIVKPTDLGSLHHEVELGVVIGKRAKGAKSEDWANYVSGYCLALDMTARDAQAAAKEKGRPWSLSKGLDTYCPLGALLPARADGSVATGEGTTDSVDPHALRVRLAVDGTVKQDGSTSLMLHRIPSLIEHVSKYVTLEPGDIILTGTPEGVGPVEAGQTITAALLVDGGEDSEGSTEQVLDEFSIPVVGSDAAEKAGET